MSARMGHTVNELLKNIPLPANQGLVQQMSMPQWKFDIFSLLAYI